MITNEYLQESVEQTHELDQIIRKIAVMAQFQADLDAYFDWFEEISSDI